MAAWRKTLCTWLAIGAGAGLVAAGAEALAVQRDLQHGLWRLAADRALATVAVFAAAGVAGGVLAAFVGMAGGAIARRVAPRASGWVGFAARASGALPIAIACAALLRIGIPDARVPDLIARVQGARGPNVLVVLLDTVRADRLSSYGNPRRTTPELDAFAQGAIRYPNFWSTAPWTLPAHASLFTGVYPMRHGATQEHLSLAPGFATLAEVLRNAGWDTFAASANPIVGRAAGLDQGFARFVDAWRDEGSAAQQVGSKHPVTGVFERFLAGAPRERPFFAFLNYMEAHSPYTPAPEFLARFAPPRTSPVRADRIGRRRWYEFYLDGPYPPEELSLLSDLYDAEVAQLSAEIGRLLGALRKDGRYDDTLVVITSDHGEHFGEHGLIEHMFSLYEPVLRIPLLLRLPGGERAGDVDERLGQLVDLPPALLRRCGVDPAPLEGEGVDLLDARARRDEVVAEYYFPNQVLSLLDADEMTRAAPRITPYLRRLRSVLRDGRKLLWSSDGRHELYDLRADPGESRDLYEAESLVARDLGARLEAALARWAAPAALAPPRPESRVSGLAAAVDDDTAARLRELGYVR